MGIPGIQIVFDGPGPSFSELSAAASKYGGMLLVSEAIDSASAKFVFAQDAQHAVTVRMDQHGNLWVCDFSRLAPVLYQLLWEVLITLGGAPGFPGTALKRPIALRSIVRAGIGIHLMSAFVCVVILVMATAALIVTEKLLFAAANALALR